MTNKHSIAELHEITYETITNGLKAGGLLNKLLYLEKAVPKTNKEYHYLIEISKTLCRGISDAATIMGVLVSLLCKHDVLSVDTISELFNESPDTILSIADVFEAPETIDLENLK